MLLQNIANMLTSREWLILITAFVAGMITMLVCVYVDLHTARKNRRRSK